jgi:GPH family glycoside/pentoside/hexuronide:cation symporter
VRIVDAFTDPLMGWVSDRWRSPLGRRRPFVIIGALLTGAVWAGLWMFPRGWEQWQYLIWYAIITTIYFSVAKTIYETAYFALGIELTPDYHERTRVVAVRAFFQKGVYLVSEWIFVLAQLALFVDAIHGMRWLGAITGGVAIATAIPVAIFTRERYGPPPAKKQGIPIKQAMLAILKNRPFLQLTAANVLVLVGLGVFSSIGLYLNVFYVFGGDKLAGGSLQATISNIGAVLGIVSIPLCWWLCRRYGKVQTLRLAFAWMIIGTIIKWWCYDPAHPWLQVFIPIFYATGVSSVYMIIPAILPDTIDQDEYLTGERREAMLSSIQGWVLKMAVAASTALSGLVIEITGFDVSLGANQAPETFWWMRLNFSIVSGLVLTGAFLVLWGYPLSESRMAELRKELEARRAKAGGA